MGEKYPQVIYAYAILLDNKIENWSVRKENRNNVFEFSGYWNINRLNDYKLQKVCWVCDNAEECIKVFENLAPKWFKTWKHSDGYKLQKAY